MKVMLFTIRPVQTFIGQARKVVDLLNGSRMLSDIIAEGMRYTKKMFPDADFIYPSYSSKAKSSYPNLFICLLDSDENYGSELKDHLNHWLIEEISKKKGIPKLEQIKKELENRIRSLLTYDWVIIPTEEDQMRTNEKLRQLVASVKKISQFDYFEDEINYSKCTNCGERGALVSFGERNKYTMQTVNNFTPNEGKSGELLCGVCLAKRFWSREQKVSSVAEIANKRIEPLIKQMSEFEEFRKLFGSNFDIQALHYENLSSMKSVFNRFNLKVDQDTLKRMQTLSKTITKKLQKENNVSLQKYYAILLLDGDNMGQIIGGEFLKGKERTNLFESQKEITKNLDEFTEKIRHMFENEQDYRGELVYAGGDDVLAILEYSTALETARNIRTNYPKSMGGKQFPTASAGLVFVHYRSNLAYALTQVRDAEKRSKNTEGKDSITVGFYPRGGSASIGTFKWQYPGIDTLAWLSELVKVLKSSDLSSNFIYTLQEEFVFLLGKQVDQAELEMVQLETERLVNRSLKTKSEKSKEISEKVASIVRSSDWNTAVNLLQLADALARRA